MMKAKSRVLPLLLALWLTGAVSCAKPALSEESGNTPVPPAADPVPAVTEEARETEAITEPETEPETEPDEEASAESELTREEIASMRSEISRKRETANTDEEVAAWRAELREFDKRYAYATGTAEPETEAIPEEEYVMLTAESYSGEIDDGDSNYNDNVTIELLMTASVSQTVCQPGDKLTIISRAKNIGEPFMYLHNWAHRTTVTMVYRGETADGKQYTLTDQSEYAWPEAEHCYMLTKPGYNWSMKEVIQIPHDAPAGMYDLEIRLSDCWYYVGVIENAIEIVP